MPSSDNQALMFVATDVDPDHEAEWNRWYDSRHIPQRKVLPGFLTARRYQLRKGGSSSQRYLALYDLDGPEALQSEEYLSLSREPVQNDEDRAMLACFRNRLRGTMRLISDRPAAGNPARDSAEALLVVGVEPQSGFEEEFNAWYEEEHIPYLTAVPGVLGVRRFQAIRDDLPYVAIWELANADVRGSEEWRRASQTPWTKRMFLQHCRQLIMGTYEPIGSSTGRDVITPAMEAKR
jgi:antibiotic biosynthesis monooxygenase (ABM) superfamily enzyme